MNQYPTLLPYSETNTAGGTCCRLLMNRSSRQCPVPQPPRTAALHGTSWAAIPAGQACTQRTHSGSRMGISLELLTFCSCQLTSPGSIRDPTRRCLFPAPELLHFPGTPTHRQPGSTASTTANSAAPARHTDSSHSLGQCEARWRNRTDLSHPTEESC